MGTTGFSTLPEVIISHIISFTSPLDAIRSSAVSSLFHHASKADWVWDTFLPSDFPKINSRLDSPLDLKEFSTKKDLYLKLCTPMHIDNGMRMFWLEKATGKKCYMLCARELSIERANDDRFWTWPQVEGSYFPEVANLVEIRRLNISGEFDTRLLSCETQYEAYIILRMDPESEGLTEAPPTVSVTFGSRTSSCRTRLHAEHPRSQEAEVSSSSRGRFTRLFRRLLRMQQEPSSSSQVQVRGDGWLEVQLGQFYNEMGDDGDVKLELYERGNHWKRGLIIHGIQIRPKTVLDRMYMNHGRRMFWLEKETGKKCYMLSARELTIIWGGDHRYWTWPQVEGSYFQDVAHLATVCWLHISGNFDTRLLSSQTSYAAYLVLRIDPDSYGLTEVPPTVSVTLGAHISSCTAYLIHLDHQNILPKDGQVLHDRGDGWQELELGQFLSKMGEDGLVTMELYEKGGHWKRGLIIHGLEIRPKTSV